MQSFFSQKMIGIHVIIFQPPNHFVLEQETVVVNLLLKGEWAVRSEPVMFSFKFSAMYISKRSGYNQGTIKYYLSSCIMMVSGDFFFSPWSRE